MVFLKSLLGVCIGIIAAVVIIVAYIYIKVRSIVGPGKLKELKNVAKIVGNTEVQEYSRPKSVGGITTLIEPAIIRDFGDFNKDFLFAKVEKNLRSIFTALEEKSEASIKKDEDLIYIYAAVKDKINDMQGQNVSVKYDDVKFHAHAIKNYTKSKGRATITISSTLEYYYSNDSENNKKKDYNGLKKQTRYTTEYVYVYDETKFQYNARNFGINCPNCGAPLEFFGAGNCAYCGMYVEPINLKNWFMVSYKEDY